MPQKTLTFNHPETTIKLVNNGLHITATVAAKVKYHKNGVYKGEINVPLQGIQLIPAGPAPNPAPLYKFDYINGSTGGIVTITY